MQFIRKYRKALLIAFKLIIFIITIFYIYDVVIKSDDFKDFLPSIRQLTYSHRYILMLAFGLMFVNWGLESLKWKILLVRIQKISFSTSFMAVLSGVTVSTLMPNRLAEYLGRIFYLSKESRIKAILATLVGNFAQLLITIIMGSTALVYFLQSSIGEELPAWPELAGGYFYWLLIPVLLLNILLLVLYFNFSMVRHMLPRKALFKNIRKYIRVFNYYHAPQLGVILILSFVRYGVFLFQYYLLLKVFGVETKLIHAIMIIPVIFLVQSVVPTIALAELGIRGATALHFLKTVSGNVTGILAGAYSLWIINLVIPAAIGALLLLISRSHPSRRKTEAVEKS